MFYGHRKWVLHKEIAVKKSGSTFMPILALMAGVFFGPPALASAGYVNNADQWAKLTPAEKAAYVQGLNDTANFVFTNDDLQTGVLKSARTRCLIQTRMTPNLLSDVITSAYEKTPQLRNQPPMLVYFTRMSDVCRAIIVEERTRIGLPPQ